MVKIDKTDIANINFLKKELKLRKITTVKIKKGNYEIELASENIDYKQKILQNLSQDEVNLDSKRNIKQDNQIKSENIVKSPMVGVAYLSADPDAPAYVKVGQHVKAGDTLLLIEAMKTFNEIKAPKSGVIKNIVALNSQPVEFGDHLLIFE